MNLGYLTAFGRLCVDTSAIVWDIFIAEGKYVINGKII